MHARGRKARPTAHPPITQTLVCLCLQDIVVAGWRWQWFSTWMAVQGDGDAHAKEKEKQNKIVIGPAKDKFSAQQVKVFAIKMALALHNSSLWSSFPWLMKTSQIPQSSRSAIQTLSVPQTFLISALEASAVTGPLHLLCYV
jgi:hypothetical protein